MAPETAECLSAAPETELLRLSFQASPSVVECFKNGGGVPYSQYPGFAKVEADITCATLAISFSSISRSAMTLFSSLKSCLC